MFLVGVSLFRKLCLETNSVKRTVIRLNMVNDPVSRRLLEPGSWPKGVTCRPWLSYSAYRRYSQNPTNHQHSSASYDKDNGRSENLPTSSGSWDIISTVLEIRTDYNPFSAHKPF